MIKLIKELEIIKPDDWHVHFRDGEVLQAVVPETTRNFARSIVMPNIVPPILNGQKAHHYKKIIEKAIPKGEQFIPFMTIYLTENTDKYELKESYKNGLVFAVKLYPAGATTNSDSGVKDLNKVMPILETMAETKIPLLIHGEVTDKNVDIFDREKIFIDRQLSYICEKLPELKITLEHITTKDAVMYVKEGNKNLVASITPHHLALNRNAIFHGGIRPHNYCLPILKREIHRQALLNVAVSGDKKFFLGTDSAPHFVHDKESDCGCAGVFNSTYSIPILAQIFENEKALINLEKFVSINGAKHYNLNLNKEKIKLKKISKKLNLKKHLIVQGDSIRVFDPGFSIFWKVVS